MTSKETGGGPGWAAFLQLLLLLAWEAGRRADASPETAPSMHPQTGDTPRGFPGSNVTAHPKLTLWWSQALDSCKAGPEGTAEVWPAKGQRGASPPLSSLRDPWKHRKRLHWDGENDPVSCPLFPAV